MIPYIQSIRGQAVAVYCEPLITEEIKAVFYDSKQITIEKTVKALKSYRNLSRN